MFSLLHIETFVQVYKYICANTHLYRIQNRCVYICTYVLYRKICKTDFIQEYMQVCICMLMVYTSISTYNKCLWAFLFICLCITSDLLFSLHIAIISVMKQYSNSNRASCTKNINSPSVKDEYKIKCSQTLLCFCPVLNALPYLSSGNKGNLNT